MAGLLASSLLFHSISSAQTKRYTISGFVREAGSLEPLLGVNIYIPALQSGTTTNVYGFYSITLPEQDTVTLIYSYVGYEAKEAKVRIHKDHELTVELNVNTTFSEVQVEAKKEVTVTEQSQMSKIEIPVGRGVAGWVASTREAIIINDVGTDARFLQEVDEATGFETKRIMAAPLVGKGELFGVIELINKDSGKPFTEDDLDSLRTMVKYGSIILHNALMFNEMEEMTKRDDLTSLFNSRYQNWFLEESIKKATQYQGFLSIIFLDLDNFKSVNDNYGHLAGSSVLVDVAQLIKEAVREEDVASRYGGDEFTFIQPGLTAEESRKYAEAISRSVCNYNYRDIRLTVSIGIASFPEHGSTTEAILSKSDKAMYKRKMNQKNGIEIAE